MHRDLQPIILSKIGTIKESSFRLYFIKKYYIADISSIGWLGIIGF